MGKEFQGQLLKRYKDYRILSETDLQYFVARSVSRVLRVGQREGTLYVSTTGCAVATVAT